MAPARAKAYGQGMRPSILNPLFADITRLTGVGPKLATLMAKVAGPRIVDLVHTLPTGLIDRSYRPALAEAATNAVVTVSVRVDRHDPPPNRRQPYRVVCSDKTGFVTLCFFHARSNYLQRVLPEGSRRLVSGKLEAYNGGLQITHPDHIVDPDRADGLPLFEPVYPLTAGLSGAVMGKAMRAALSEMPGLPEWQDQSWLDKNKWPGWADAVAQAHMPTSAAGLPRSELQVSARQRLSGTGKRECRSIPQLSGRTVAPPMPMQSFTKPSWRERSMKRRGCCLTRTFQQQRLPGSLIMWKGHEAAPRRVCWHSVRSTVFSSGI